MAENLLGISNEQEIYAYDNILGPGVVCPYPGAIYMYMTKIFKHLLLYNRLANQSQTLCGVSSERVNESLHK